LGDTAVVTLAAVLAFALAPPAKPFVDGISSPRLWAGLQQRLLPQEKWFGLIGDARRARLTTPSAADITTGSVLLPTRASSPAPASSQQ
jgi:hypothetical protein